ncbi:FMN-linked oxidoreductase [Marasmius fiardii PR-910]|nr:FMN-linked oxidoreductase [Marasmius fiardii PR-910]
MPRNPIHLANRQSFYRHRIIPRMLVDTNTRDTATTIFGHQVPAPIGFAPIGINKIYHPLGELPVAKVAGELGSPYCLSTAGSSSIEDVAKAKDEMGKGLRFFQLYMPHDDELTVSLLKQAEDSGFKACILTLDTWQLAWRHDDINNSNYRGTGADLGLSDPVFQKRLREMGIDPKKQPNEAGTAWIDNVWHGRAHTWEKGIQNVEDARKAVEIGCHGIVVNNHVGRQVDGAVASLDAMEKIVEAVGDKTYVMFDSGARSGPHFGRKIRFCRSILGMGPLDLGRDRCSPCLLADFDILLNVAGYRNVEEIDGKAIVQYAESGDKNYALLPELLIAKL